MGTRQNLVLHYNRWLEKDLPHYDLVKNNLASLDISTYL